MGQQKNEPIAKFVQRLRSAANQCAFRDAKAIDSQIALKVIQGCKNPHVRKKGLHDSLEIADIIKFAKTVDVIEAQAKFVEDYFYLDVSGTSQRVKQEVLAVGGRHQHKPNTRGHSNKANFSGSNRTSGSNFHNKAPQRLIFPSQSKSKNSVDYEALCRLRSPVKTTKPCVDFKALCRLRSRV